MREARIRLVWPNEAEVQEALENVPELPPHPDPDFDLLREAIRIVLPYMRYWSDAEKRATGALLQSNIRTEADLVWLRGLLESRRRYASARAELKRQEESDRERRSNMGPLVDHFNRLMGLDEAGRAPRGWVPGPDVTEDDLDLITLEHYLRGTKGRKERSAAERQVACNFLQRDSNRSDREIARRVGISPTIVGRMRRRMESNGLIPARNLVDTA